MTEKNSQTEDNYNYIPSKKGKINVNRDKTKLATLLKQNLTRRKVKQKEAIESD